MILALLSPQAKTFHYKRTQKWGVAMRKRFVGILGCILVQQHDVACWLFLTISRGELMTHRLCGQVGEWMDGHYESLTNCKDRQM